MRLGAPVALAAPAEPRLQPRSRRILVMNACRMCGQPVAPSAKACPHCGAASPNIGDYRVKTIISALFAVAVAALLFTSASGNTGGWKVGLTIAALFFLCAAAYGLYLGATGK